MANEEQDQPKFRVSGKMLFANDGDITKALELAAKRYIESGGDESDDVTIIITFTDNYGNIGVGDARDVDMSACLVSFLAFGREGDESVEFKLEEELSMADILERAGVTLEDGEELVDSGNTVVDLDETLEPNGDDDSYTIRKKTGGEGSTEGGEGAG